MYHFALAQSSIAFHTLRAKQESFSQRFATKHPILSVIAAIVGLPLCILGGVTAFTMAVMAPIALLLGWM